jgi:hypothetical protein
LENMTIYWPLSPPNVSAQVEPRSSAFAVSQSAEAPCLSPHSSPLFPPFLILNEAVLKCDCFGRESVSP